MGQLKQGDKGPEVAALKAHLKNWGFDPGEEGDVFGPGTAKAVREYHQHYGFGDSEIALTGPDAKPMPEGAKPRVAAPGATTPGLGINEPKTDGDAPPDPPGTTVPTGPVAGGGAAGSAQGLINGVLGQYGLSSLASWAWGRYLAGIAVEQIMVELRDRPEYAARFPAMKTLAQRGRALSENEYIAYEQTAAQLMRQYGLPPGFYDQPSDFAEFLSNEVSVAELSTRLGAYQSMAFDADPRARDELRRLYGVSEGDLTAFFIDADRALPLLMQKARGAQAAASSLRTGYGAITLQEADRLGMLDPGDVAQGFGQLSALRDVFQQQLGETEGEIGRETQFAAAFEGNTQAAQQIEKKQRTRTARFSEGGGYASSSRGFTGVGAA